MIKIACHSLPWANFYKDKTYDIREILTQIKTIGYDGVELVEPLSAIGEADSLKKFLHILGLELVSLSASLDKYTKERIDFLRHFDTNILMLCAGWITKNKRKEGLLIQSLRNDLEEIAQYAEKQKVSIAFHPHKGTIIETREDLEDFYSEETSVNLCLDVAHLAACGSNPLEALKEFRKRIVYVHLKDYNPEKEEFVELGRGRVDLESIIEYLKDNYNGWVTVELDSAPKDPVQSAQANREYLKGLGL